MIQLGRYFKIRIFIAIVLLGFGINGFLKMSAIARHGAVARASVTKIYQGEYDGRRNGSLTKPYAEMTFSDAQSEVHKFRKFMLDKDLKDLSEGDEFDVLYDSSHPANVVPKALLKREIVFNKILITMGIVVLVIGLFIKRC